MTYYVEEFFYRGRAPGEAAPIAMQITVGEVPDGVSAQDAAKFKKIVGVMSPAKAAAAPYNLSLAALSGTAIADAAIALGQAQDRIKELEDQIAAMAQAVP